MSNKTLNYFLIQHTLHSTRSDGFVKAIIIKRVLKYNIRWGFDNEYSIKSLRNASTRKYINFKEINGSKLLFSYYEIVGQLENVPGFCEAVRGPKNRNFSKVQDTIYNFIEFDL